LPESFPTLRLRTTSIRGFPLRGLLTLFSASLFTFQQLRWKGAIGVANSWCVMISVLSMPFSVRYVNQGDSAQPDLKPDPEVFKPEHFRVETEPWRDGPVLTMARETVSGVNSWTQSSSSWFPQYCSILCPNAPTTQLDFQFRWANSSLEGRCVEDFNPVYFCLTPHQSFSHHRHALHESDNFFLSLGKF
jgi:hypothetical protein